ncbi:MAG TPA: PilZ domain-containing protein [Candidatus Acidoferrum sp.]
MSDPLVSDRMAGTAGCASKRPGILSMLGAVTEVAEVEVKVETMKQNQRTIVRRRTQQLVYLELGRENGGVMLNLSEEGCGFQAITPVKCGETRFGFQINGGRRIAGDAEVVWADDSGVMGGLRFLNLPPEAHKEIRLWLEETNAPMEYGFASAAAASAGASGAAVGARAARTNVAPDPLPPSREAANVRIPPPQQEAPPPPPAWSNARSVGYPVLEEQRYASPFTEAIIPYSDPQQRRSASVWRGIAVVATVIAVFALGIVYQKDVGSSLIWLGETMSGKTKASTVAPVGKPANATQPSLPTTEPETAATSNPTGKNAGAAADPNDPTAADMKAVDELGKDPSAKSQPPAAGGPNASNVSERSESVLERQNAVAQKPQPNWSETDSVEALWGAVQAGSVSAEVSLAERFARGAGVNKNCDQAKVLMKAAADKGNREARLRLYELESGGCQ